MQRARFVRILAVSSSVVLAALLAAGCGELPTGEAGTQVTPAAPAPGPAAVSRQVPGQALTQDAFCPDATSCAPTGAHGVLAPNQAPGHAGFDCKVCHWVGGRLAFQPGGPAFGAGLPAPTFDATAKTCSNVACHTVPAGSFSYYFPGGDGEPVLNTVYYGGGAPRPTPSWYATGAIGCSACHDNPPRNGSTGSNVWHSGTHGGQGPTGAYNQCQFCHPDATGSNNQGTAITNPTLHGNGVANVQARFTSACFGCH